ncbi:uncharacterized protein [Haliotis asinina]|uniref:uncharacterized protein n=1 Tax=Haliotis asinina TaxID=109174 RepID=UPI00353237A7
MSSRKQPPNPATVPFTSPRRHGLYIGHPEKCEPEDTFTKSSRGQQVLLRVQDEGISVRGCAHSYRKDPVEIVQGHVSDGRLLQVMGQDHLPLNGAIPYPALHVGDKVTVRQFQGTGKDDRQEVFLPATVKALPERPTSRHGFYTVILNLEEAYLEREVKRIDVYPRRSREEKEFSTDDLLLIRLRKLLPPAKIGEDVLFKSPDDGWYYLGKVSYDCCDFSYIVTDCNDSREKVWREDIICESDRHVDAIKKRSKVLVMHPLYPNSYCPATVIEVQDKAWKVHLPGLTKFKTVYQEEDYIACLVLEKGAYDEKIIKVLAKKWETMTVLAKHKKGEYHIGAVKELLSGSLTEYVITWLDQTESVVDSIHVFGGLTPLRNLRVNDHVLAPVTIDRQENPLCYLPGVVVQKNSNVTATIKTIHSHRLDDHTTIDEKECFFISPLYYIAAAADYLKHHHADDR